MSDKRKTNAQLLAELTWLRGRVAELEGAASERLDVKEALQNERNKVESLIGAMVGGLTIQNRDFEIIYQNETLKQLFGGVGDKCYHVYEGREAVCEGCPVKRAFEDGQTHRALREATLPSGEIAYFDNVASPLRDASGEVVACIEVTTDVTAQRRQEQALYEAADRIRTLGIEHAELERMAVVGEMASIVAHDIRTPLNALAINLQLAGRAIEGGRPDSSQRAAELIAGLRSEVWRINALIEDYLRIARPSDATARGAVDIAEVIDDAKQFVEKQAAAQRVTIEQRHPSSALTVRVDPRNLRQVLVNLLTNALQAMPDGGTICLSSERIEDQVRIRVEDDGPGIPADDLERVFKPFVSSKEGGTGLGLAICSRIVGHMHGRISAAASSSGARIDVEIPLAGASPGATR